MDLCKLREDTKRNIHAIIDKFAERGLRSLAVARQVFIATFMFEVCL